MKDGSDGPSLIGPILNALVKIPRSVCDLGIGPSWAAGVRDRVFHLHAGSGNGVADGTDLADRAFGGGCLRMIRGLGWPDMWMPGTREAKETARERKGIRTAGWCKRANRRNGRNGRTGGNWGEQSAIPMREKQLASLQSSQ